MTIYFTSDLHLFHRGALRFGERTQFETVEQMNDHIIAAHNRRVEPRDTVYYLGDLSFGGIEETVMALSRMNGRKYWVLGNHDEKLVRKSVVCSFFDDIQPLLDRKFGDQRVTLCHYPMLTWNKAHYGAWMLHGHSHGNCTYPAPGNRIMDVGIDTRPDFAPWSLDEIAELMSTRGYTALDHHADRTNEAA
jgi:calcineurin-like phosphoesterase family protein